MSHLRVQKMSIPEAPLAVSHALCMHACMNEWVTPAQFTGLISYLLGGYVHTWFLQGTVWTQHHFVPVPGTGTSVNLGFF